MTIRTARHLALGIAALSGAAASGIAPPAGAEIAANGYYLRGFGEAEYLTNSGGDDRALYGDLTFGFLSQTPTGVPLGFEFGFLGVDADHVHDYSIYATGRVGLGDGVLAVGIPRSPIDDYFEAPALGGSQYLDLALGQATSSFTRTYYLFSDDTPYGLRYDLDAGDVDVAASYHHFADENIGVIDLAGRYRTGGFTFSMGLEDVDGIGASGTSFIIGAEAVRHEFGGGVFYSNVERPDTLEAWTAYGSWQPMQPLKVTGSVISARENGNESTLYGLSADYTVWEGAYVQGGWLDGDGLRSTLDMSVGWRF